MTQFIQIHMLTSYPAANLNRDDTGRPKTVLMGGAQRLRISSQSLKRAWRTSSIFEEALEKFKGTRTKRIGIDVYEKLQSLGVEEKQAREWAKKIAEQFGKLKKEDKNDKTRDLEVEQLVHFGPGELNDIEALVKKLVDGKRAPKDEELNLLHAKVKAVDISMFGRMLADSPINNVEAAVQVAHSFTVHSANVEDDYFTAVDDLNRGEEDRGSAHIGELGFGAGVFYTYLCINRDLLLENLSQDQDLVRKSLQALTAAALEVAPSGKQNSFASRARASYALVEKGSQQPRSLSAAFLKPIQGQNTLHDAVTSLEKQYANMDSVYGPCAESRYSFNVEEAKGKFDELIKFISE